MTSRYLRTATLLALFAALPMLSAESCAAKPAQIKVVSVTLAPQPGRAAPAKVGNDSRLVAPVTKSDGGRFVVPANVPGTFEITFTSDTFFTVCTLDLDGRTELDVTPIGSGQWTMKRSTGALAPDRSVSGSLTCTPTAGIVEPAVSTFEVVARPMARLAASPQTIDFGGVLLGARSPARTVKVTNVGDNTTIVERLVGSAAGYSVSSSIKNRSILRPGQSFSITVSFAPDKVGTANGIIGAVIDTDRPTTLLTVTGVGGTSHPATFAASSTWLKFGEVRTGGASQDLSFTISNTGLNAMQVGWLSLAGNDPSSFSVVSQDCTSGPVTTGATCTVTVRFTPTKGGYNNANLRVGDDAAGTPHEITLTGDGIAPAPPPAPEPTYSYPTPP